MSAAPSATPTAAPPMSYALSDETLAKSSPMSALSAELRLPMPDHSPPPSEACCTPPLTSPATSTGSLEDGGLDPFSGEGSEHAAAQSTRALPAWCNCIPGVSSPAASATAPVHVSDPMAATPNGRVSSDDRDGGVVPSLALSAAHAELKMAADAQPRTAEPSPASSCASSSSSATFIRQTSTKNGDPGDGAGGGVVPALALPTVSTEGVGETVDPGLLATPHGTSVKHEGPLPPQLRPTAALAKTGMNLLATRSAPPLL